LASITKHLNTL